MSYNVVRGSVAVRTVDNVLKYKISPKMYPALGIMFNSRAQMVICIKKVFKPDGFLYACVDMYMDNTMVTMI